MKTTIKIMLVIQACLLVIQVSQASTVCKRISVKTKELAALENFKGSKKLCNAIYKGIDVCKYDKTVLEIIKTAEITGCI